MFGKKYALGLDLGLDSLKVAIVDTDRNEIVDLWTTEALPQRSSRDQQPEPDGLEEMLKGVLAQAGTRRCRAIAGGVQGLGSVYGYLELPKMSPTELGVAVPAAVRSRHPFLKDAVSISYVNVPCLHPNPTRSAVFYVGVNRNAVDRLTARLRPSGAKLARIETTALALAREHARNHPNVQGFTALVHTGFELTHVVVVRDGHPYYVRDFSLAGRDFTYAVQMGNQSTWDEAENYKRATAATNREVMLEPFVQRWLDEVNNSLRSASAQLQIQVDRVVLSGRTAQWRGLDQRLSEHLKVSVRQDHWEGLRARCLEDAGLEYRVAVGLALGA